MGMIIFNITEIFLRRINCLARGDKLVKVKSWKLDITDGYLYWPTLLVDTAPGRKND